MSSVLKALKKLESIQPQEDEPKTLPQKITAKEAINKRVKGHWIFNRALSVVMIAIITAFGTWLVLSHGPFLAKEKAPVANQPEPIKDAVKIKPTPTAPEKLQSAQISEKTKSFASKPKETPKKETPKPLPLKKTNPPPIAPDEPQQMPVKAPEPQVVKQVIAERPVDASQYKLEAIVWSNQPASRFAVINGRIVRTGGSVEGLSIKGIGRDFVTVRSGDFDWKLRFMVEGE